MDPNQFIKQLGDLLWSLDADLRKMKSAFRGRRGSASKTGWWAISPGPTALSDGPAAISGPLAIAPTLPFGVPVLSFDVFAE